MARSRDGNKMGWQNEGYFKMLRDGTTQALLDIKREFNPKTRPIFYSKKNQGMYDL